MARVHPDRIPQHVRDDVARDAECQVYEALRDQLPDDWHVFAWVSWVRVRRGDGATEGEADFLLAHPEHGLLVLEVKGGVVRFDAASGAWTSESLGGSVYTMRRSPLEQARANRHAIEAKLRETPGWTGGEATFGWAVAFPDCALPDGPLGPDAPREVLLPYGDLSRLDERIPAIARSWRRPDRHAPLGPEGVAHVARVFAKPFALRMPLGRAIAEDARRAIELSERQFTVLDGLSRNRRVLVTGGAGTGKTLLALEKAKRLAREDGFRTLLTCFNRPLAEHLRASAEGVERLTVMTFHELCFHVARSAGLAVRDPTEGSLPTTYFREALPALLVDGLARTSGTYEAIVVDEGQDFSATDRAALELLLEDRAGSVLYVFQDETQALYREASPWPVDGLVTYELTENLRNTRAIHEQLARLSPAQRTRALGPGGRPPEFIAANTPREQARAVSRVLDGLIRKEQARPASIAVLVSSRRVVPELVEDGRIGAYEVTTRHDDPGERVLVESVTRFKGLERDVVVLARLEPVDYCEFEPMLYVGAGRARAHLVVVGDPALLARFGRSAGA